MEDLKEKRKGEVYIFFEVLLWALFPIITTLTYIGLPAMLSFAWSVTFSAIFFGCIVLYRKTWIEIKNPELWKYIFFITLFIAILFYGFYFIGLSKTTPGNAALIGQFEICTSFLFFHLFRKDHISKEYIVGAFLMLVGALIVLAPNISGINIGDFLVLAATFCTPIGNHFQRKARKIASSETIMFLRTTLSIPVIFLFAYIIGTRSSFFDIKSSLPFLIVNGMLLLGLSKILWIEGIHRMPVMKANALGSIGPLLTLLLAWVLLRQIPTAWQLVSLPPLIFGTLFLTDQIGFHRKNP